MAKYAEKVSWYTKTMIVLVKHLKIIAKCCLKCMFFLGALYCCVRYSSIKYQDEILQLIIKSIIQKVIAKSSFKRRFHDLKYFEVGYLFHIPYFQFKTKGIITKFCDFYFIMF